MVIFETKPVKWLEDLYVSAFPPEERRPWANMPVNEPYFTMYAAADTDNMADVLDCDGNPKEDKLAGFVTVWHFDGFDYIEHLAVNPAKRGNGTGAQILKALPGNLLLEVEPAERGEMARRRISFYVRNGFSVLDVDYIQPPYGLGLPEVPLKLMARGDIGDVQKAIKQLHSRVYGKND